MKRLRAHEIKLDEWRCRVVVLIGGSDTQLTTLFKRYSTNKADTDFFVRSIREASGCCAITLQPTGYTHTQFIYLHTTPKLADPYAVNSLAHECLHVTFGVMKHVGVRLTSASEEVFCYAHGHLIEQVWLKLKRPTGVRR